jgi:hypothetical protein
MNNRMIPPDPHNIDSDKISRQNYASDLLSTRKWFDTANEMAAALAVLEPKVLAEWEATREWAHGKGIFPEYSVCGIYMMLAGLLIENLCKGDAVNGLSRAERERRDKLQLQIAAGKLEPAAILRQCWKLKRDERDQVKKSGELPKRLGRGHDLPMLVANTGLSIDLDEEELLERLKRAVLWFGRYPVPTTYQNSNKKRLKDGRTYSTSWLGGTDTARISALIERLRNHLGAARSYRVTESLSAT